MDAVGPVQTCVGSTADVVVGQRGAAQLRDDAVDPAVDGGADQVDLVAVVRVTPDSAWQDV